MTHAATCMQRLLTSRRDGNVLGADDVRSARRLARQAETNDGIKWTAPSPSSALAWLLVKAHQRATSSPIIDCDGHDVTLLSFRGQAEKYTELVPSIDRAANARSRAVQIRTQQWLQVLLQLWFNQTMTRPYHLDRIEVEATAQHYGVPTNYVDWTWDPATAFHFAVAQLEPGDRAVVLVRHVHPESRDQVLLPPPFVRRVWSQFGLFQRIETLAQDAWQQLESLDRGLAYVERSRRSVDAYERIIFAADADSVEIARNHVRRLTTARDPLLGIVQWARAAAHTTIEPSRSLLFYPELDVLKNTTRDVGLRMPLPSTGMRLPHVSRRTADTYVKKVATRRCRGKHGYSPAAAKLLYDGMAPLVMLYPRTTAHWEWLVREDDYLYALRSGQSDFVAGHTRRKSAV